MTEKKKKSIFLPFCVIAIIFDALLFPSFFNCILVRLLYVSELRIEGLAFLRWDLCFQNATTVQIVISGHALYLALLIVAYFKLVDGNKKRNRGDEHGSARLLTDEEFDKLIPVYMFRKDEYKYQIPDLSEDLEKLAVSNVDIFEKIEFKEASNNEES